MTDNVKALLAFIAIILSFVIGTMATQPVVVEIHNQAPLRFTGKIIPHKGFHPLYVRT